MVRSNSDPEDVARELQSSKTIRDPAREKLLATGKAVVDGWVKVAATLDAQGEIVMAGDVRYYAVHLPPVLTDREKLATAVIRQLEQRGVAPPLETDFRLG